ncbi:MAG: HRDC domain-containing protein, partial [Anaerolineae bacterium]|nr:HRDC domain-containing protein [Anaerolineae bacterium]
FGVVQEAERLRVKGRRKEEVEYTHALFALLRQKRKEMADADGVPPYVIFSDRTLTEMAAYYPQSRESLLKISGVGQAKLSQYGDAFLAVIKPFCEKHGIEERARLALTPNPSSKATGEHELGGRTRLVAEAFNEGATIQTLMERQGVTKGTILEHLTKYAMAGNKLRNGGDLQSTTSATPEQQQATFAAFDESGTMYLKPVYDKLNGALNYDELKVLRLLYLASKP